MTTRQDRAVRRQISTLFNIGVMRDLSDGQLLERFSTGQGEAAELAFAALVERHGPMVMRVCRARLSDPHDALDAFQATFLVLVEKSRGLWVRDSLGPWLHQVASRTALCALSAAARRRRAERTAAELAAATEEPDAGPVDGWERALHEEINRLPERYRVAIVLCDLEGHTCEEAARRIGRPVGTVKCWRARGRERLRQRLIRSGLTPSSTLGAALAADIALATIQGPEAAEAEAARALADSLTAGVVPASVQALVKGVFKAMILSKLKTAAAVICALAFLTVGLGTAAWVVAEGPKGQSDKDRSEPAPTRPATGRQVPSVPSRLGGLGDEAWSLSLRDAVRIGLGNSQFLRVVSREVPGGGSESTTLTKNSVDRLGDAVCVIQPVSADANAQRFKAEVMVLVRSIEQQYWNLSQQYVQLWAAEKVVDLIDGVVKSEQAKFKVGRGTKADVAEASQRLEQSRLDLVTRTADVITTERQLRHLIGLPEVDRHRIVPVSVPVEAKLEPDWDTSLAVMLEKQPDVVQAKKTAERTGTAAIPEAVTRTFLPDLAYQGTDSSSSDPTHRKSILLESNSVRQMIHQATHSLARYFLEIDANYKQYQTAKRLRADAADRMNAQSKLHDEGRISLDRYLDAVSQYAQAVAQEAQFKTTYNNSIVALEEAKGTLLEYDKITVVEPPGANKPEQLKPDAPAQAASFETPAPARYKPFSEPHEPQVKAAEAKAATPGVDLAGRTISFQMTINVGSRPVEIRGSFTVSPAALRDGAKTP